MKYDFDIGIIASNLGYGGGERVLANLLPFICEKYWVLLVIWNKDTSFYDLNQNIAPKHIIKFDFPVHSTMLQTLHKLRLFRKIKCKYKAKIWWSIGWSNAVFDFLSDRANSVSIVHKHMAITLNNGLLNFFKYKIYTLLVQKINPIVVTCSYGLAELVMNSEVTNNVFPIYNPVPLPKIDGRALTPLIENIVEKRGGYIVAVGRLHFQKGYIHLLRIYKELLSGIIYPLVILGDSVERKFLLEYAKSLGLRVWYKGWGNDLSVDDYDVFFMGKVDAVPLWLENALLMVSPSLGEGFGLNIAEALSMGCPVVASDCLAGPREILDKLYDGSYVFKPPIKEMEEARYGILAPVPSGKRLKVGDSLEREEREWVRAIKYALDNREMMVKKANIFKENVLPVFSPENVFREWEKLLDRYLSIM